MITNPFTAIHLQQFRSYDDFGVELTEGVNIVVGPNASGKTNLLESLLITCGICSYRANYIETIQNGAEWAKIDANFLNGNRIVKLTKNNYLVDRLYEINQKPKKRLNFYDIIPVILFEPDHLRLLTGSPDIRRDFFDAILIETDSEFITNKQKYKRTLAQRNHLLKNNPLNINDQIFAWNIRLAELAGKVVQARINLIEEINKQLSNIYGEIAQKPTDVKLKYLSDINTTRYESSLLHKLESNLEKDLNRGFTTYGPHREDVEVLIKNKPANFIASRGETRTLVLSLKLIELKLIELIRDQKPLILLDDVFSELDGARRRSLTQYLNGYQTIITTTDADIIQKQFIQNTNLISL